MKTISITIDEHLLKYIDEVAEINNRSRSGMISWIIRQELEKDQMLDEEFRRMNNGK